MCPRIKAMTRKEAHTRDVVHGCAGGLQCIEVLHQVLGGGTWEFLNDTSPRQQTDRDELVNICICRHSSNPYHSISNTAINSPDCIN